MFEFICIKFDCEYVSMYNDPEQKDESCSLKKKTFLNLYCKLYTIQNQSKLLFKLLDTHLQYYYAKLLRKLYNYVISLCIASADLLRRDARLTELK